MPRRWLGTRTTGDQKTQGYDSLSSGLRRAGGQAPVDQRDFSHEEFKLRRRRRKAARLVARLAPDGRSNESVAGAGRAREYQWQRAPDEAFMDRQLDREPRRPKRVRHGPR